MAGDEITATSLYYYKQPVSNSGSGKAALTNAVVNALTQTLSSGTSAVTNALHGQAGNITAPLTGNTTFGNVVLPNDGAIDLVPKAYLTVLFFDERFSFLGTESVSDRVKQAGDNNDQLRLLGIKAPKNGYAYVYLSNESDEHVYFDQLKVQHTRGRIIEENHYYAYGLKIAGISSHKLADANEGNTDNKYLYNDKELDDEGDLNWLDYGFRNYDSQIGRFVQVDPLTDAMPDMSSYHYAYDDPITNIDQDGLMPLFCPGTSSLTIAFTKLGETIASASSLVLSIVSSGLSIGATVGKVSADNKPARQGKSGDWAGTGTMFGRYFGREYMMYPSYRQAVNFAYSVDGIVESVDTRTIFDIKDYVVHISSKSYLYSLTLKKIKEDYDLEESDFNGEELYDIFTLYFNSNKDNSEYFMVELPKYKLAQFAPALPFSGSNVIPATPIPGNYTIPNSDVGTTTVVDIIVKKSQKLILKKIEQIHGGGKNAQHKNQKARAAAKEKYEAAKAEVERLSSLPNKTKEDKEALEAAKTRMKYWKRKMDETGENHSRRGKT